MTITERIRNIFVISGILLFVVAGNVSAFNLEERVSFFIESDFDVSGRSKIESVLVKISPNLYFFVEKNWWDYQYDKKKEEILKNLDDLSFEFQNNIYPKLTSVFGFERRPGIDKDERITALFHPTKGNEAGYFRSADGYEKIQISSSNEREMVYISTDFLTSPKLKVALAHEFVHLITFNQKNINFMVEEEVWLNEARADFSSTILGYDDQYSLSNLQSRVRDFIESPSNSIVEWKGTKYDYASVALFTHYLVDHYGVKVLADSLKSGYIGIESINYALESRGYKERFSDVFTNWTIAVILNNCSYDSKYCYLNKNLAEIKISPNLNFLPITGNTSLSVVNATKNWSGNWQKFIGGNGDLKINFSASNDLNFVVPYILEDKNSKYLVNFLNINSNKKGTITIPNFSANYNSLIIIPSLQSKFSGFNGSELAYPFSYSVSVGVETTDSNQSLIQQLLAQIESLKKQTAELQPGFKAGNGGQNYCSTISENLYFGLLNNNKVRCLQQFLKSQGADIYPEGLVTGNFGNLTKRAVIRFQEKYKSEILTPLGLSSGTGYVGFFTRAKINQILKTF